MKIALVAFNGEAVCFAHVLLNALDMVEKGNDVKVIIEGAATQRIGELNDKDKPFGPLYLKVKDKGLIDAVCKACSMKMGTLEEAEKQGLPLKGQMSGHPPLMDYITEGYQIITF